MTKRKKRSNLPAKNQSSPTSYRAELFYQGPLPPASQLEKYNQIFPGCAERIVAMAESQSKHRQDLETMVVKGNLRNSIVGPICGLIVCLTALGLGAYLIMNGKSTEGLASILTALGIPAAIFVGTYFKQKRELERKGKAFGPAPYRP